MENVKYKKYLFQNIDNLQYLFHESPTLVEKVISKAAKDSNENQNNIATAVFLFPSFLKSVPYAFKDTIKQQSKDLKWNFTISNQDEFPLMVMENVIIDENIEGYVRL